MDQHAQLVVLFHESLLVSHRLGEVERYGSVLILFLGAEFSIFPRWLFNLHITTNSEFGFDYTISKLVALIASLLNLYQASSGTWRL